MYVQNIKLDNLAHNYWKFQFLLTDTHTLYHFDIKAVANGTREKFLVHFQRETHGKRQNGGSLSLTHNNLTFQKRVFWALKMISHHQHVKDVIFCIPVRIVLFIYLFFLMIFLHNIPQGVSRAQICSSKRLGWGRGGIWHYNNKLKLI